MEKCCSAAVTNGIPVPAISSALGYFDGYRCEKLPANLFRHNAIILEHIPMKGQISPEVSFSTQTGQAVEEQLLHQHIMFNK